MSALFIQICYGEFMKKLFLYIFLVLVGCNAGFANEIEFSKDSINDNITNYGWEIYKNEFIKLSANQTQQDT